MQAPGEFALSDAEWLAHRHIEGQDRIRFIRVPRALHRAVPFLIDAYLGDSGPEQERPVEECLRDTPPGHLHFVFHSAFCGSTVLVRALDWPGSAMGLSEPMILNDIVGFRRRGAPPTAVARLADVALRLLARPFEPDEQVVVKPSNVLNPLAELMLAIRPEARAVFLHAPLETFLVSVARKGLGCRLWVRELAEGYLTDNFLTALGTSPNDVFRQTDLQVAATGWLAQHLHFTRLAAKLGPGRLRSLDSELLTAQPASALTAVAGHLGLAFPDGGLASIVEGPAFTRHSKSGAAYSSAQRASEYAEALASYHEEIEKVMIWANAVAGRLGLSLDGPAPLAPSQS